MISGRRGPRPARGSPGATTPAPVPTQPLGRDKPLRLASEAGKSLEGRTWPAGRLAVPEGGRPSPQAESVSSTCFSARTGRRARSRGSAGPVPSACLRSGTGRPRASPLTPGPRSAQRGPGGRPCLGRSHSGGSGVRGVQPGACHPGRVLNSRDIRSHCVGVYETTLQTPCKCHFIALDKRDARGHGGDGGLRRRNAAGAQGVLRSCGQRGPCSWALPTVRGAGKRAVVRCSAAHT